MKNKLETTETALPAPVATLEPPTCDLDSSDSPTQAYGDRLLSAIFGRDQIPFLKLVMLAQFLHRSYHRITLGGPLRRKQLVEDYRARTFRSETIMEPSGNLKTERLLLRLEAQVFGYLEGDEIQIYAPTPEAAHAAAKEFQRYVQPQEARRPSFYIISIEEHGPVAQTVTIERPAPVTTEELALNYGADFPAWENQWREQMERKSSGLSILYGPPGCGKTSYLRALMARLLDQAVFYYVPVSEVDMLSHPRFVNFWLEQAERHQKKHKLAILEDAEELLLPRDAGTRDRVSNLLNLADGFLGDHLKLQVIATTNAPVRTLDAALLRPGRLTGIREFRRLTRSEAQGLALAKGLTLPDQSDYSLAEMYCGAVSNPALNANRQVGFAQ